ncbi:MAG TPA: mechanosensitive ion channel family protein [Planctomycetota bacterium]
MLALDFRQDGKDGAESVVGMLVHWPKLLFSAVWVSAVLLGRWATVRALMNKRWQVEDERLRWRLRMSQIAFLLLLLGMLFIWAPELHSLALSAVAIAAALVLASKELLMCVSGSLLRMARNVYTVGDRIEIGALRGDVIDYGFLSTTLLEIGPGHQQTGRAITFPNSLLLGTPVVNESFTHEFVLHRFTVPVDADDDWEWAERTLLEAAQRATSSYLEAARSHLQRVTEKHALTAPQAELRVAIQIPKADEILLLVRVPVPARRKGATEQEILRAYLLARRARSGVRG